MVKKNSYQPSLEERELLELVKFFIRTEVFDTKGDVVNRLIFFKHKTPKTTLARTSGKFTAVFSIDQLVAEKVGVCSHHASCSSIFHRQIDQERNIIGQGPAYER